MPEEKRKSSRIPLKLFQESKRIVYISRLFKNTIQGTINDVSNEGLGIEIQAKEITYAAGNKIIIKIPVLKKNYRGTIRYIEKESKSDKRDEEKEKKIFIRVGISLRKNQKFSEFIQLIQTWIKDKN